jgi:hypothetical protein
MISHRPLLGAMAAAALAFAAAAPAHAQSTVRVGWLTCNTSGGWGFVVGSEQDANCTFSHEDRVVARYKAHIEKWGVDIGYHGAGVLVWGVFAPSSGPPPGSLAGEYGGVQAGAAVGVGANANVLVGGNERTISLQPLSVEGATGVNVAAGVNELTLEYVPN